MGTKRNFSYKIPVPVSDLSSGVYGIYCKEKNSFYIGSSRDLRKRLQQHNGMLKRNEHHCHALQADFNAGYNFETIIFVKMDWKKHKHKFDNFVNIEYLIIKKLHDNGCKLYNYNLPDNTIKSLIRYYQNICYNI